MADGLCSSYWVFAKHLGKEIAASWRAEVFSSLGVTAIVFVLSWVIGDQGAAEAFYIALVANAIWLSFFAIAHISRAPHLALTKSEFAEEARRHHWKFGLIGILSIVAILTGSAAGVRWLYSHLEEKLMLESGPPIIIKAPAAPNVTIRKIIIKTTGSGRLDRDMNNQQSNHLYEQLKQIAENPKAPPGLRNITMLLPYPQDRESVHLFNRLRKVFTDAQWNVTTYGGWPFPALEDVAKHELPIGIWIITDNQYLEYGIWSELQQAGLESQQRRQLLPQNFKGTILVVGYKDVPF
jgi:hypothetical protein